MGWVKARNQKSAGAVIVKEEAVSLRVGVAAMAIKSPLRTLDSFLFKVYLYLCAFVEIWTCGCSACSGQKGALDFFPKAGVSEGCYLATKHRSSGRAVNALNR